MAADSAGPADYSKISFSAKTLIAVSPRSE